MNSIKQMKHFFDTSYLFDSRENNFIGKKSALLSGLIALQYISTPTATLMTVIILVLTGQPLTPVNVFTLLSFINLLRSSFCMEMSYGFMVASNQIPVRKKLRVGRDVPSSRVGYKTNSQLLVSPRLVTLKCML